MAWSLYWVWQRKSWRRQRVADPYIEFGRPAKAQPNQRAGRRTVSRPRHVFERTREVPSAARPGRALPSDVSGSFEMVSQIGCSRAPRRLWCSPVESGCQSRANCRFITMMPPPNRELRARLIPKRCKGTGHSREPRATTPAEARYFRHAMNANAAVFGAGSGNRTRVFSLEGCCSTIELYPHGKHLVIDPRRRVKQEFRGDPA